MKKLFITFLFFFLYSHSQASWQEATLVSSGTTFDKVHWVGNILNVYEDYYTNPFNDATIIRNELNGVLQSYSVNGVVFNAIHPLFFNATSTGWWVTQSPGISTAIQYLENTYTMDQWIPKPNQNVKVRKYYKTLFNYDTTAPTCWDIKLYNDQKLTQSFNYTWGWINSWKYFVLECSDPETGCKCESDDNSCQLSGWKVTSVPKVIWHLAKPTVSFVNNVDLRNNECSATLPWGWFVLYDSSAPYISLFMMNKTQESFNLHLEANRNYDSGSGEGNVYYTTKEAPTFLANDKNKLLLTLRDEYIPSSVNGVSWVREYSVQIDAKDGNIYKSKYTTSWKYTAYNTAGSKQVSDMQSVTLSDFDMTKSGDYKIVINVYDWAWNHTRSTSYFTIYPAWLDLGQTQLTLSGSTGNKYANNVDFYQYELALKDKYGNPIHWKRLELFNQDCGVENGCKTITTNMVDNSWNDAIREVYVWTTNANWVLWIKVYWLAPGEFNQRFIIKMFGWDQTYTEDKSDLQEIIKSLTTVNSFLKPHTGTLSVVVPMSGKITLWTSVKYKLTVVNNNNSKPYLIENFVNSIKWYDTKNHEILNISSIQDLDKNPLFNATLIAASWAKSLSLDNAWIQLSPNPVMTYNVWTEKISYRLTTSASDFSLNNPIEIKLKAEFLWIQIIGSLQGEWNSNFTGQKENFSDLSTSTLRAQIRKNAYLHIANMQSWNIVWWVKYVDAAKTWWKVVVPDSQYTAWEYETLVVKNWNVVIQWDLTKQKLWIIVLADNYNVNSDFNKSWNVYITPSVRNINAVIYADGWLISADSSGKPYVQDSSELSDILKNQLVMKGTLFTRNTIGWVIKKPYVLPGWSNTTDFNNSMLYDLNYLRRGKENCEKKSPWDEKCLYNDGALVIIYDSSVQLNPPKLFGN